MEMSRIRCELKCHREQHIFSKGSPARGCMLSSDISTCGKSSFSSTSETILASFKVIIIIIRIIRIIIIAIVIIIIMAGMAILAQS